MHQITAFGGLAGKAPFQQAVLQSAAFQNVSLVPDIASLRQHSCRSLTISQNPGNEQQEITFERFLSLLNVSTLQEARELPSSALIMANSEQVGRSEYGQFTYGPVVDGLFAPAIPGKLLLQGSFDRSLNLMLGFNADEGLSFTSPFVTNDSAYSEYLLTSFPDISDAVASYVENELYPPPSNSTPYRDEIRRASMTVTESTFICNTLYLDRVRVHG